MNKYVSLVWLLAVVITVGTAQAAAPRGTVVWKAGFENGDFYPEIANFERNLIEKVNDDPSLSLEDRQYLARAQKEFDKRGGMVDESSSRLTPAAR